MTAPILPMPPHRVLRDFLDADTHATLLAFAIANEMKFLPTEIQGGRYDPTRRISFSWRDFEPLKGMLRERIRALVPRLIAELRVTPFECARVELELVAHGDGAFYKRHLDIILGVPDARKTTRMISGVYYFHAEPRGFTGGALRLYPFGSADSESGFVEVEPEQNTLVAFPSWAAHEVMPVSCPSRRFADSRFAINCWMRR
jgi:SM-20-related protein